MNINDLFAKKTPLKLGEEIVEGIFIQEAPLSELAKLQAITKEKDIIKKLEMATSLVELCVVDANNEYPFKEKPLSNQFIMDIVTAVMEVNLPSTGK